jgi:hypothetical protein
MLWKKNVNYFLRLALPSLLPSRAALRPIGPCNSLLPPQPVARRLRPLGWRCPASDGSPTGRCRGPVRRRCPEQLLPTASAGDCRPTKASDEKPGHAAEQHRERFWLIIAAACVHERHGIARPGIAGNQVRDDRVAGPADTIQPDRVRPEPGNNRDEQQCDPDGEHELGSAARNAPCDRVHCGGANGPGACGAGGGATYVGAAGATGAGGGATYVGADGAP